MADLLGVHPSELGALNAANASETALQNAAPNSRVGRIAAYRDTVLAGDELRTELEEKEALLDGLTPPDRPISEIDEDIDSALSDVQGKQNRVTELEEALADAGGTNPDIEAQLQDANDALQEAVDTAENLEAEKQAAVEYDATAAEVDDLTDAVENQALTEREALENAANKPVTDAVEAAVKSLLGLDS
jgi:chromosome segregation ATPase